jgi:hypothetical protein
LDAFPLKSAEKGHRTIVQPLLHYHFCNSTATVVSTLVVLQTRNEFQITPSQDNNQIKQSIIGDDQASTMNLFDVLAIINISLTPLYKGVNT